MKLVETTLTDEAIRMRFADESDPAKASEWIWFQLQRSNLKRGSGEPVGNLDGLDLRLIQRVALQNVQDALDAEIERLK